MLERLQDLMMKFTRKIKVFPQDSVFTVFLMISTVFP